MSRRMLPPPPPPAEIRAWPDREALLADRVRAMGELSRRSIRVSRLLLLWLMAVGLVLGWSAIATGFRVLDRGFDVISVVYVAVYMVLGLLFMVPAGLAIGFGIRRDKRVRERLAQWSSLESDPVSDARFRSPGASLLWFLPSFLLCALGLWMCLVFPATAQPGRDTCTEAALVMGFGFISWLTGLLGVAKAVSHHRWAVGLATAVPRLDPCRGGAHH